MLDWEPLDFWSHFRPWSAPTIARLLFIASPCRVGRVGREGNVASRRRQTSSGLHGEYVSVVDRKDARSANAAS